MTGVSPPYKCVECHKRGCVWTPMTLCSDCKRELRGTIPWEHAAKKVEAYTGTLRDSWIHEINHPYGRATDSLARFYGKQLR